MKIFRSLTVTVFILFICMSGQAFTEENRKKIIGFIPMTMSNEYFVIMVNAARSEAEKQHAELLVQSGKIHRSGEEQEEIIENMMAKGVDAVCIVPSSGGAVRKLRKVQQAKIPIVNIDTKIDTDILKTLGMTAVPYIGTNNYEGAKSGGEYAVRMLGISGKEVAVLIGISQQQNAKDRWNGFKDAVGDKVRIVAERPANWEKETGYSICKDILQKKPDLAFVFACNDNMALGALEAVRESGRKNIGVMGYDGISAALNAVEEGAMAATVAQMPAEMGIRGVRTALEILKGNRVPEITHTETKVIDSSNVAEFKAYLNQYK